MVNITARTKNIGNSGYYGGHSLNGTLIANGECPFCNTTVGLRQLATFQDSSTIGAAVPVRCDNCHAVLTIGYNAGDNEGTLYPSPTVEGVDDAPELVDKYYQEALNCLSADAPSGAATLFRKTIHAIAIHYEIAEVDDTMGIYDMVNRLKENGEINEKLRKSLNGVKDLGNDGAHINENEPDMEQAIVLKGMIDSVLLATVIADQRLETTRQSHPNEFAEEDSEE
jgi:hypothetical protein